MKRFPILLLLALVAQVLPAQTPGSRHFNLLIGTYTGKDTQESIHVYDFDAGNGALTRRSAIGGIDNPSFLTATADGGKVYAVSEVGKGKGKVYALRFDAAAGELTTINSAPTGGGGPCYVSIDKRNRYVFAANYGTGSLCAIPVLADGSLDSNIQVIQHEGKGIDPENQAGPHVHSVVVSPDNKFLLSADLGLDKVFVYRFNAKAHPPLIPMAPPDAKATAGSGPRHIAFHPNGKFVYVVHEMGGSVSAFRYTSGKLSFLQNITMLAPGFKGTIEAADIHLSADGRFLYATNREVSNELLIYAVNTNGTLRQIARESTLGKAPRNFAIDPTGKFLLIANLNSDEVKVFSRDPATGLVHFTGTTLSVKRPSCLQFVPMR